ncbi:Pleckstrin homology domain-containing protein [Bombardia bombarda]|uniref:Pleckstrin homology domain-containing protein n=1 Tax=Bombardia bombarda TaxID=252184 RepID=A0AA40BYH4_9PEZI|nr:Pleckstrin homology domain-containing protein [Bombardia bombarda]
MAEEQKPVEVPKDLVAATEPVAETKPVEVAPATTTEAEAAPTAVEPIVEAAAAPAEEAKKEEEVKPVDEGSLEHKGQGANFPKNLIYSKKFFWFGSEPVDLKAAAGFKADKAVDVAHHVTAWAAETGKGLLFFSEKTDKTPHGVVQLAEASEPVTEGTNKFHFTSKGHKHTFKAGSATERDSWVAQLKTKIAEAKELAETIAESETYKNTLESLKPAPAKKEEKPAAAEPVAEAAAPATTEEAVTEAPAAEPVVEEAKKEEEPKEEPKARSASRKRNSIFSNLSFGKKPVEVAPEVKATEPEAPVAEASTAAPEVAAVEAAPEVPAVEAAPVETAEAAAPVEDKKEEAAEKPANPKRSSIFGSLPFGKKKAPAPEAAPVEETPATTEAVAETAPVIPAVETTEPLSAEVSSPATVPTETVEATPATNGETKKEVKSEKRKSSHPFAFGKKEKASSDEEGEKPKSPSRFSKFRATIKGKGKAEKSEEKSEETAPIPEAEAAAPVEEAPKVAEPEVTAPVVEETPEVKPLVATPAVTAAA